MEDQFKLMREYMGDEIVKWMLIPIKLREYLTKEPIKPKEDFDLNPHLNIIHICKEISKQMKEEDIECIYEEVMQCWLTIAVYHGELLPSNR